MCLRESRNSDRRFAIDAAFRQQSIEIPLPQRDLRIRGGWLGVPE